MFPALRPSGLRLGALCAAACALLLVAYPGLSGGRASAKPAGSLPASSCPASATTPATRTRGLSLPPYSQASPLNTPIPGDARVSANSAEVVSGLVEAASGRRFVIALHGWTVPIFYAGRGTPRYNVPLTADWAPRRVARSVPIPRQASPDPRDDGHMVVVDRARDCEYDFYRAVRTEDGRWSASWLNSIRLSGNGVFPRGASARGSGFALLGGLIFPAELRRGDIRHALVFSYPYTKAGRPVPPATESDGRTESAVAVPEGTRLRLDPSLDLSALGLAPYERTIARTLQVYGMYLADTGGGVSLYAANPLGYARNPYVGLLPDESYVPLDHIPLDRLQVIAPSSG